VALVTCIAPKKCDEPERCEVLRQLSMWRQLRALYGSKALVKEAYAQARAELGKGGGAAPRVEAIEERAASRLQELVKQRANDGKTILLPNCPGALEDPPGFSTDEQCAVRPNRTAANSAGNLETKDIKESDVEGFKACRELVEAARAHEQQHRTECCKVTYGGGCTEAELAEVTRRTRCAGDPSRAECQTAYGKTKGVPPRPPARDTVAGTIQEEKRGYTIAIQQVQNAIMANQPSCSTVDAKFKKAQEDLFRRAKLLKSKKRSRP
jgi:hypothetical protein